MSNNIWEMFNLWDNNLDQWGSILYYLRYDKESLELSRNNLIKCLQLQWVVLEDLWHNWIWVKINRPYFDENKILILLEELSVRNWALEYFESFWKNDISSIKDLFSYIKSLVIKMMSTRNIDLVNLYNFLDHDVSIIIRDLELAEKQNWVLSESDKFEISEMKKFLESKLKQLNNPNWIIIFW